MGRQTVQRFAAEGATVVIADIDSAGSQFAATLTADTNGEATFVETGATNGADVQAMIQTAITKYGGLDIGVDCVGVGSCGKRMPDISLSEWKSVVWTST